MSPAKRFLRATMPSPTPGNQRFYFAIDVVERLDGAVICRAGELVAG